MKLFVSGPTEIYIIFPFGLMDSSFEMPSMTFGLTVDGTYFIYSYVLGLTQPMSFSISFNLIVSSYTHLRHRVCAAYMHTMHAQTIIHFIRQHLFHQNFALLPILRFSIRSRPTRSWMRKFNLNHHSIIFYVTWHLQFMCPSQRQPHQQ